MKNSNKILGLAILGGIVYYLISSGAAEKACKKVNETKEKLKETAAETGEIVKEKAEDVKFNVGYGYERVKEEVEENFTSKIVDFAVENKETLLKFAGILLPAFLGKSSKK